MGYMTHPYKYLMADTNERNILEDEGVNRRGEGEKYLGKPMHRWVGTKIKNFQEDHGVNGRVHIAVHLK